MISVNHVLPQIWGWKGTVIPEDLLLKEITGTAGSDIAKKQDYRWVTLPWKAKCFNHSPAPGNRILKATLPQNVTKPVCQAGIWISAGTEGTAEWLKWLWGLQPQHWVLASVLHVFYMWVNICRASQGQWRIEPRGRMNTELSVLQKVRNVCGEDFALWVGSCSQLLGAPYVWPHLEAVSCDMGCPQPRTVPELDGRQEIAMANHCCELVGLSGGKAAWDLVEGGCIHWMNTSGPLIAGTFSGWAPDGAVGVPDHCRAVGPDGLQWSLLTETILWLWWKNSFASSDFHQSLCSSFSSREQLKEEDESFAQSRH